MGFASKHPLPLRIASGALWFSLTMIAVIAVIALAGTGISLAVSSIWRMLTGG